MNTIYILITGYAVVLLLLYSRIVLCVPILNLRKLSYPLFLLA